MKLYFAPGTCSLACWISLEWAGADYEVIKVDPRSNDYKKINPLGMVPALDIGGKRAMTQADAILQHIADNFPAADLGSNKGAENRFEFNETMCFLTGDFHPAFWPMFAPQRYTTATDQNALAAVREAAYSRIERVMNHLNTLIGDNGGHLYQGKRSVADAYAFVMARWSERAPQSWRDYPQLAAFMQRMEADSAVIKVLAESSR